MALPPNYRQVALMGGQVHTPHNMLSGSSVSTSFLRERLARTSMSLGGIKDVQSPFTTTTHGNPAFNPQKMGSMKGSTFGPDSRVPKPPKAPDKPLMPYMRYSRKVWDQVKAANSSLKLWEIGKVIGSMWRDLAETDKQDYYDEYEAEKMEYDKAIKNYHASPSYQAYLNAKNKGPDDKDTIERAPPSATLNTKIDSRRIDIQPAEEEDDYDESLSVKHVAHARYMRNHRLVNEIFSDTVVPDVRTVVTAQRLSVLRRQVQSLTMHQKKLEKELEQIEDKFEAKKRKFVDAGDSFQTELKKVKATAPRLDEASFLALVEKQKEIIQKEMEEKQKPAAAAPVSTVTPTPMEETPAQPAPETTTEMT